MSAAHAFQTIRLDLEPVTPAHAREAWPNLDDPRMWTYFPSLRPGSPDDLRRLYAKWQAGASDVRQQWENWLARDRASGALVGGLQTTIFPIDHVAYIAYAIYAAQQRRGYAREAAQALIEHLRSEHGMERVFAEMDTRNAPSYKLVESLGFARVKTRTAIERGSGSHYGDEYLYELRL